MYIGNVTIIICLDGTNTRQHLEDSADVISSEAKQKELYNSPRKERFFSLP